MQSPVFELLEHNAEQFAGKKLVIAGNVRDERILRLMKDAAKADVITDNYLAAAKMAGMMGQATNDAPEQHFAFKHLTVHYAAVEKVLPLLDEVDLLLILIDKSKTQNQKLLALLSSKLTAEGVIFTAGENDSGGKSADTLLKIFGDPVKSDSRRKCTLFGVQKTKTPKAYAPLPEITYENQDCTLRLLQDEAVFSQGRIDDGTKLLLEAIWRVEGKSVLDLGCGCGVVGLALKSQGIENVLSTDVSAAALELTRRNAELNNLKIDIRSADMLEGLGKFDAIVVNPPFHQGIKTELEAARNMIRHAPEHLNAGGELYLVGNSFLGYEEYLRETFGNTVKCVEKTTRFCIYQAKNV